MKNEDIEKLARRYCEYLGLSVKFRYDPAPERYVIAVWPVDLAFSSRCVFHGWDALFFGEAVSSAKGLCRASLPISTVFKDIGWFRVESRIIEAGSLEELDLQLSVRGF